MKTEEIVMAVKKFADLRGKAKKEGPDRYKFQEGINAFRMVSDVVPGYKYWMKMRDGSPVPMDCLDFDRDKEVFTNKAENWVTHYFPDMKCSWAYTSFVIDRAGGKLKIMDHKKTLLEQVINLVADLGDPTDPVDGWDIIVDRQKTGPKVYNVKYEIQPFKCQKARGALTTEEQAMLKEQMPKDIEEFFKVPTPEQQLEFLKSRILPEEEEIDEETSKALANDDA